MGYPGKAKWIARPATPVALSYGLALVTVAGAFGLSHTFLYFHLHQTFTALALSAIAITFCYGGTKPGILAALLALLARQILRPEADAVAPVLDVVVYALVFVLFTLVAIRILLAAGEARFDYALKQVAAALEQVASAPPDPKPVPKPEKKPEK